MCQTKMSTPYAAGKYFQSLAIQMQVEGGWDHLILRKIPPSLKKDNPEKKRKILQSPTGIQNFHMFECVWPFCGVGACRVNKESQTKLLV